MTLVTTNPGRKVRRSNSLFDAFFNDFLLPTTNENTTEHKPVYRPAVNVIETNDHFKMDLAIPGFTKEDVTINVDKDVLTIEGRKEVELSEGEKYLRQEIARGNFKRTFHFPDSVDANNITANFTNGVLNITLAKKEEAKELPPRTIEING
jgi:HSP20 family protein